MKSHRLGLYATNIFLPVLKVGSPRSRYLTRAL
jgi:hypothetical protein